MTAPKDAAPAAANRQLRADNVRLSRLIGTVAHELRNPLACIATEAYLFRNAESDTSRLEAATALQSAADRLLYLANELLTYSRIDGAVDSVPCEAFDPTRLAAGVIRAFERQANARGLALEFCTDRAPCQVWGYAMRVEQILVNLLDNALKYTDSGCIVITLAEESENWSLSVRDEGIGVPVAHRDSVFEEFSRVDSMDHVTRCGAGLGLAICRRLCDGMGGAIRLDEARPRGSLFTVTLPRHIDDASSPDVALPDASTDDSRGFATAKDNP